MVFICWTRPSPKDQKDCLLKSSSFNYDSKYWGLSSKPLSSLKEEEELEKDGFSFNHARTLVGSGIEAYEKGREALQSWSCIHSTVATKTIIQIQNTQIVVFVLQMSDWMQLPLSPKWHFGLDWAFVDPKTPTKIGTKFCVCVKEVFPWIMMPLQVVYVNDVKINNKTSASFGFGSGTLKGHLLAGEERFSIELDEKNQVWYEILSFSKPAHFLSVIGLPYVHFMQKYFAHQSTKAVKNHISK